MNPPTFKFQIGDVVQFKIAERPTADQLFYFSGQEQRMVVMLQIAFYDEKGLDSLCYRVRAIGSNGAACVHLVDVWEQELVLSRPFADDRKLPEGLYGPNGTDPKEMKEIGLES